MVATSLEALVRRADLMLALFAARAKLTPARGGGSSEPVDGQVTMLPNGHRATAIRSMDSLYRVIGQMQQQASPGKDG